MTTTIQQLDALILVAQENGYQIRYEYLGGAGGGLCEFGGRKWLFVDLALNAIETLEMVRTSLLSDPSIGVNPIDAVIALRSAA